jgi:hypothetical protein
MKIKKKTRTRSGRLTAEEYKTLTEYRTIPLGRLTDKEYQKIWNNNVPKEEDKRK